MKRLRRFIALVTGVAFASLTSLQALPSIAHAADQPKIRFYHYDHLGSTTMVTDEQGQVVYQAEYAPYGATVTPTGTAQPAHQFTGQRFDSSTGLYYFKARYYDPRTGRFLSPDPMIQDPGDPQSLNAYSYVRNNPVNLVDPTGEFFQFILAAILAISAIATSTAIYTGVGSLIASATGHERAAQRLAKVSQVSAWIGTPVTFMEGGGTLVALSQFLASAADKAAEDPVSAALDGPSFNSGSAPSPLQHTLAAVGRVGAGEIATNLFFGGLGAAARAATPHLKRAVGSGLREFAKRYGPQLAEDTIPAGQRLSPYRIAGPSERYVRYESSQLPSRLTPEGGLTPNAFVTPEYDIPLSRHELITRYQLPRADLPRDRALYGVKAPGDIIIGPRPVSRGSGTEALFPFGTRPGTVRGQIDIEGLE